MRPTSVDPFPSIIAPTKAAAIADAQTQDDNDGVAVFDVLLTEFDSIPARQTAAFLSTHPVAFDVEAQQ